MTLAMIEKHMVVKMSAPGSPFWFVSEVWESGRSLIGVSRTRRVKTYFVAPTEEVVTLECLSDLLLNLVEQSGPDYLVLPYLQNGFLVWGYADFAELIAPGDVVGKCENVSAVHFGESEHHILRFIMYSEKRLAEQAMISGKDRFSVLLDDIPYMADNGRQNGLRSL